MNSTSIWNIAKLTLKIGLRERILYGVLIFSLVLILIAVLISGLFMRDVLKILLDICLSATALGGLLIPFFLTINSLIGDIEKRSIYTMLSKDISRNEYILGKYLGFLLLSAVIMLFLTLATIMAVGTAWLIYPHRYFAALSIPSILSASFISFLGIQLFNSAVFLWCNVFSSSFLATLATICTYLIGNSVEDVVRFLSQKYEGVEISVITEHTANMTLYLFPNLAAFDLKQKAAHGLPIYATEIGYLTIYACAYIFLMLFSSTILFRRRDLP